MVARQAHDLEVAGPNPAPATIKKRGVKSIFILFLTAFMVCSCNHVIIYDPNICDSTIYHHLDSVVFRDSIRFIEKEVPVFRDSVVISDTIRLIETGKGNLKISGAKQHVTFYIDLDSIRVVIRNDSIIDAWQRPAGQ